MSLTDSVRDKIKAHIQGARVHAQMEGSHLGLVVVSDAFEGLNLVKKQQLVYAALADWIASGEVHAVNMQAFTPGEWENAGPFRPDAQFE